MSNLIHRRQYQQILFDEGVEPSVIERLGKRYEHLPADVVYKVATDDGRMGPSRKWSIPFSPKSVKIHDLEDLLIDLGYPITTNLGAQRNFAKNTSKEALIGLLVAVTAIPVIVAGGGGSYIINLVRDLIK